MGLHLRWVEWGQQPSGFYVNQVFVLWGSFDGHPSLIRIVDSGEILKSYRNTLITFKFILIVQLWEDTEDLWVKIGNTCINRFGYVRADHIPQFTLCPLRVAQFEITELLSNYGLNVVS